MSTVILRSLLLRHLFLIMFFAEKWLMDHPNDLQQLAQTILTVLLV